MNIKKQKGFTLIELLVVIAIIGILSAVVLASLNTARLKARNAQRISDVRQMQLALEFYFDSNRTYPAVATIATDLAPTFLPVIPTAPPGGAAGGYDYDRPSATVYCLGTDLEGGTTEAAVGMPGNDRNCDADGAGADPYTTDGNQWYSVSP